MACFYCSIFTVRNEGYVFTSARRSVHGGGVCYPSMHCRWHPSMHCSRSPGGCLVLGGMVPGPRGYYPSMHCRWYPSMPCSGSPGGVPGPREGEPALRGCLVLGDACFGGCLLGGCLLCLLGGQVWRPPQKQTATVVDGTHPTGMHSCFKLFWQSCSLMALGIPY